MSDLENQDKPTVIRLVARSALLGAVSSPITQGEYWYDVATQAIAGVVVCLILYGLEKVVLWPVRKRSLNIKPLHSAAYRGALLLFVMSVAKSGDMAQALGASLGGALFAMLLFVIERWVIKQMSRKGGTNAAHESNPEK